MVKVLTFHKIVGSNLGKWICIHACNCLCVHIIVCINLKKKRMTHEYDDEQHMVIISRSWEFF
jgi:hypothetical protein